MRQTTRAQRDNRETRDDGDPFADPFALDDESDEMRTSAIRKPRRKRGEESPQAAYARERYLSLGAERSISKLARLLKSERPSAYKGTETTLIRHLKDWSRLHGWADKAREYDREREDALRKQVDDALTEMNATQAKLAAAAHIKVLARINDLLDLDAYAIARVKDAQDKAARGLLAHSDVPHPKLYLAGHVLVQFWREGVDVERLARDAATEIVREQHAGGVAINIVSRASGSAADSDAERPLPFDLRGTLDDRDHGGDGDGDREGGDDADSTRREQSGDPFARDLVESIEPLDDA